MKFLIASSYYDGPFWPISSMRFCSYKAAKKYLDKMPHFIMGAYLNEPEEYPKFEIRKE